MKRFRNVKWRDDKKCDMFMVLKRMIKNYQGRTGEQYITNDNGMLVVCDEDEN